MSRPTKFDLMRANRDAADWRNRDRQPYQEAVKAGVTAERLTAVPSMELYGVKYVEAPETNICDGCALNGGGLNCRLPNGWHDDNPLTLRAFGGGCMNRRVIYVRAEG